MAAKGFQRKLFVSRSSKIERRIEASEVAVARRHTLSKSLILAHGMFIPRFALHTSMWFSGDSSTPRRHKGGLKLQKAPPDVGVVEWRTIVPAAAVSLSTPRAVGKG